MPETPEEPTPKDSPEESILDHQNHNPEELHRWHKGLGKTVVASLFDAIYLGRLYDWLEAKESGLMRRIFLICSTAVTTAFLTFVLTHYWIDRESSGAGDQGPKYCLVDYSGNITEDHGVADLLEHGISMSYDNYGEPSEMYVMFTKYMIHAPVVTSVESRIFQVTPSREDLANGFHFTFEAMQTVPRTPYPKDAPFCIKMEIVN
jgi:hypothetical protein